ncbi:MAG: histidine phosphatase family protein [Candidatus Nitrotoga sp.]
MRNDESRLVLVRHARSDWNQSNRFTGWADIPLTEHGLNEAAAAGRRLAEKVLNLTKYTPQCCVAHSKRQTVF